MSSVPKRVAERLNKQVRKFQSVLESAHKRDVNEADTVLIITDILSEVFGFDKYTEITSEQAVRGTYCDLAVKLDGKIEYLIEVKAIGLSLKENHLRQALGYGANNGIPWVVLTNGLVWELYRIKFEKPIDYDKVMAFDYAQLNPRKLEDQEQLYVLCKEGIAKAAIESYHERAMCVNKYTIGAVLASDQIVDKIRVELRRLNRDVKVSSEEIAHILRSEVLKREVLEGDAAEQAAVKVKKSASKTLRKAKAKKTSQLVPGESRPPMLIQDKQ